MTIRQDPSGRRLEDGYRTLITFAGDPDISLWERTVKPFGYDGGDPIDITTMHNDTVRQKASRALIDLTDGAMSCGYDPKVLDQILAQANVNQLITIKLPDGSRWEAYGFLKSAEPNTLEEGTFPVLDCVLVFTNTNPSTGAEVLPQYYAVGSVDS